MEANKRACFAFVAATIINKQLYNSIYDYHQLKSITISSQNVKSDNPTFYDYNRGGSISGNLQNMYDHISSSNISIRRNANNVSCYDQETHTSVMFTVNNYSITAYDYEMGKYYNYSVK